MEVYPEHDTVMLSRREALAMGKILPRSEKSFVWPEGLTRFSVTLMDRQYFYKTTLVANKDFIYDPEYMDSWIEAVVELDNMSEQIGKIVTGEALGDAFTAYLNQARPEN